jgi:predicted nuclease of predicted toxin-antitoxin system
MRFLIDTNLPSALGSWIADQGHTAEHVLALGIAQAKDSAIWAAASETNAIIVSKDEDFADMVRRTQHGPCVLWLRTGNGTTASLLRLLAPIWPAVEMRLESGERLVEVRSL